MIAICTALLVGCQDGVVSEDNDTVWITIGSDAVDSVAKSLAPSKSFATIKRTKDIAVARIAESEIAALSHAMHEGFDRCGGFFVHASRQEALAALDDDTAAKATELQLVSYTIDNDAVAQAMIGDVVESNIRSTITSLASYTTRYHTSQGGQAAPVWIRDLWQGYAQGRSDVTVELYDHPNTSQKSVIATIQGTTLPNEVVVIGGHLDSIAGFGGSGTAPGADDDASGIATASEVLRIAMARDFRPQRTVKFMAYAAEEVGLRGSTSIANDFSAAGVDVVGVMQLDMTLYNGSTQDIVLISDRTNAAQNTFVGNLIDHYLGLSWTYDQCGYGCSDHASWTNAGYPSSFPFEARFSQYNSNIHTSADTLANSGGDASHAVKFAKLAAAYLAELAKGGFGGDPPPPPPPPPPGPQVENLSGSVGQGQNDHFGPYATVPGTAVTAVLSPAPGDNGDADIYVRFGQAPTTSSWDCRPYRWGSNETCNLTTPSGQTQVYVMVRGYTAAAYEVELTHTVP